MAGRESGGMVDASDLGSGAFGRRGSSPLSRTPCWRAASVGFAHDVPEAVGMATPRAVVTGGAGFLGSHLCERLLEQDYEVLCVDGFCTGTPANVAHLLD